MRPVKEVAPRDSSRVVSMRAGDDLEAGAALAQILINRSESNDDKGNPSAA
jgi:hypothetical protein